MEEPGDPRSPKPETLKLFRKKHSALVIYLSILFVLAAIAFAAVMISSAMSEPLLHH
jgi:hypothetical protein